MRISIFSAFYPFRGGIAQFNAKLFRELQSKDQSVKAFTFTKQYPKILFPGQTQMVAEGDLADKIPAKRIVNPFNPFSYFSAVKKLKKSDPDVFISNYWMTFFGVCFGFLANRFPKKVVRIGLIHNLIPHEQKFFDTFLTSYYLKRHDGFIVLSEAVEKDLLKLQPTAKVVRLFHPWYDHFGVLQNQVEARQQLGLAPDKKTILFFGLIRAYKGLELLLESFSLLNDDVQLIIAGEAYEDVAKYQSIIDKSPNKERIHFHNRYIEDSKVRLYFSAADVCALPYKSATQSGITAIAFHFELPVVVTNTGDLKKTVEDIGAGLVAKSHEPEEFSALISSALEHESNQGFRNAIKNAKQLNSWSLFTDKVLSFSNDLLKQKRISVKKSN
ncbi:MAG: glycosyltransferase [Bacteroidota bacterium]